MCWGDLMLYKNRRVAEETVPSGQLRLLSGLMAQPSLGRTFLPKERKTSSWALDVGTEASPLPRTAVSDPRCCWSGVILSASAACLGAKSWQHQDCRGCFCCFQSPDMTAHLCVWPHFPVWTIPPCSVGSCSLWCLCCGTCVLVRPALSFPFSYQASWATNQDGEMISACSPLLKTVSLPA